MSQNYFLQDRFGRSANMLVAQLGRWHAFLCPPDKPLPFKLSKGRQTVYISPRLRDTYPAIILDP